MFQKEKYKFQQAAAWRRVLLAGGLCLIAHSSWSMDLLEAYRAALYFDAQYLAAKAGRDAGMEKLPQARAGLLPSLNINANTGSNYQASQIRQSDSVPLNANYRSHGWTAQLSQPLFRWQNWLAYTQAELNIAIAEVELENARQELILRVAQAYFDVLLANDTLSTAEAQLGAINQQLASAKRNFEVGTATITDTHEAQARFDLATAQSLAAQSDLLVKRQALLNVIGQTPPALKQLRSQFALLTPKPDDPAQWADMAANSNLQVQLKAKNWEVADQEITKQRAGHYPTLDLVATHGNSTTGNSIAYGTLRPGTVVDSTTVGIQMTLPIFSGGIVESRRREAVALKERAFAELEHARRVASLNARQAYLGVSSGLAQIRAYEAAATSSLSSVESNKLGYQVGVRINIDVLNAQSQLFETRQKLAKAKVDTLLSQLRLKLAAGNLGEEDVLAINALLE